jgi:micrococcal nuclease
MCAMGARPVTRACAALLALPLWLAGGGCSGGSDGPTCGPAAATVVKIVDGDTVVLDSGEKVRYLGVDTPETSGTLECYGTEAKNHNTSFVLGKAVTLEYGSECLDKYGRLLAMVSVDGTNVSLDLLENGYACFLKPDSSQFLPHEQDLLDAQQKAQAYGKGVWACTKRPC